MRQTTTTGIAAAAVSSLLALGGSPALPAFVLASVMVLVPCAAAAVLARDTLWTAVVDEIAAGHHGHGIPEFDRVRSRLVTRRYRWNLARSLERHAAPLTTAEQRVWAARPLRRPNGAARAAMLEIGAALRREPGPPARAIAACTRFVTAAATSPLFSGDDRAIEDELRRIRFHSTAADHAAAKDGS